MNDKIQVNTRRA